MIDLAVSGDSSHVSRDLMFTKPVLTMPHTGQIVTTVIFALGAIATLYYAIRVARRDRVSYPVWLFLGSIFASTYETYDATMGHFIYPQLAQLTVYELMGVKLPLFLILTYPFYVAALVIWVFERLQTGRLSTALWWKMFTASVVGAAAFEPPFIHYGLWYYYGRNQPLELFNLPVWWMFANPAAIMCMGLLCSFVWNELLECKRSAALVIILPVSLFALHGSISAPLYLALNTSADLLVTNAGSLLTIILSLGLTWLGARYVAKARMRSRPMRGA